jgi:hypothetical protein
VGDWADYRGTEIRDCGSPDTREDSPPLNFDCTRNPPVWTLVVLRGTPP